MPFLREDTPTYPIDLIYRGETDAAVCFDDEDGNMVWLPKSQIGAIGDPDDGEAGRVDVPEWLAEREGLV